MSLSCCHLLLDSCVHTIIITKDIKEKLIVGCTSCNCTVIQIIRPNSYDLSISSEMIK